MSKTVKHISYAVVGLALLAIPAGATTLNAVSYGTSYEVRVGPFSDSAVQPEVNGASALEEASLGTNRAFAEVDASLATGRIRARSGVEDPLQLGYSTSTTVSMKDTITIDASGLTFDDIFNVTFTTRLSGSLNGNGAAQYFFRANNILTLGGKDVKFQGGWSGSSANAGTYVPFLDPSVTFVQQSGAGTFEASAMDPAAGLVKLSMNLRGGRVYETKLDARLSTQNGAEFFNTASLGIETSVPWTSASGVFLSSSEEPVNVVPLPAGAWFLLAGLGALAGLGWRKSRT